VINGKYRIDGVLGEGGVGIVYCAQHLELDERVAMKFLKPESLGDPGIVGRFAREAKAALSIKSEYVARIMDVGTLEGTNVPFIVMEYLEGRDLGSTLQNQGVFSITDTAEYVLQACEALAIAHAKGIVHRDIKPENLFLTTTQHGRHMKVVKVLDFGISKAALTGSMFRGEIPLVRTGQLMGTPLYMSPEQVRAADSVDARTDIWSLGLVMYEILTGRTAFNATSLTELCAAILERDVTPIRDIRPEIPEGVALAVQRCLQKDAAKRFQNVGELAKALLPFAPKRARICAERAVSVLREAGIAPPELAVHSTIPPPNDAALQVANTLSQQMRVSASTGRADAMSAAPAEPSSRRPRIVVAVAAAVAVAVALVSAMVFMRHPAGPSASTPSASAPAAAAEITGEPSIAPVAPPASVVTLPGAASEVAPSAVPSVAVATPAPRGTPRAAGSVAAPKPTTSASAGKPPAKKPTGEEGPDIGY
ncbi:MAG TPA: protein kinase, partial [Polyangiaceae bacterium]|nr:protein kinase [Polyangiaceae bacterium]